MRLQKYLSRAGVASRRAAERLIVGGRVRVNDEVIRELGTRVDPEKDRVVVDGKPVAVADVQWILLHKERGTVTTARDPGGRPTIYEGLPDSMRHLPYVGRLDVETEGLLLLSNDGDTVHRLLHPSGEVEREYLAAVLGVPTPDSLARLQSGVRLEDGPARAREAELVAREPGGSVVRLVLTEGRKREVRRLLKAIGHEVRWLRRQRFGPIELGGLKRGAWRRLTDAEVSTLRDHVKSADG